MADNSGILKHVIILNSGISMNAGGYEFNSLSLVGVGSGTVIENITVDLSDDDGIEIWGGTVNLKNIILTRCTDDYLDIDDGYSGTFTNLNITTSLGYGTPSYAYGKAAIEMSGTGTVATFCDFNITQNGSLKEGTITDNVDDAYGAIHSDGTVDANNTSFTNVTVNGSSTGARFTGTSDVTLENIFNSGTGNIIVP